ncbi:hypothetical protein [Leptospira interrogans]|nr:hypothetical protein [Leptospira interrogans]
MKDIVHPNANGLTVWVDIFRKAPSDPISATNNGGKMQAEVNRGL